MTSLFKKQKVRGRSGSTSIPGCESRGHGENSSGAGRIKNMASQGGPDTQLDSHWAFVKPTELSDNLPFVITLYYPNREQFLKRTHAKLKKTYFDAELKTCVLLMSIHTV